MQARELLSRPLIPEMKYPRQLDELLMHDKVEDFVALCKDKSYLSHINICATDPNGRLEWILSLSFLFYITNHFSSMFYEDAYLSLFHKVIRRYDTSFLSLRDCLKALLDAGFDPQVNFRLGRPPIVFALYNRCFSALRFMINELNLPYKGKDVPCFFEGGIMHWIFRHHLVLTLLPDMLRQIPVLQKCLNDPFDDERTTPIMLAVRQQYDDATAPTIGFFQKLGVKIDAKDKFKRNAFIHCVKSKNHPFDTFTRSWVPYLEDNPGFINLRDYKGQTALFYSRSVPMAQFLVDNDADVTLCNRDGQFAAYVSPHPVRMFLLGLGKLNLEHRDNKGESLLYHVFQQFHRRVPLCPRHYVTDLLETCLFDPNVQHGKSKYTVLHMASLTYSYHGMTDIISKLLKNDCNPFTKDKKGNSFLTLMFPEFHQTFATDDENLAITGVIFEILQIVVNLRGTLYH